MTFTVDCIEWNARWEEMKIYYTYANRLLFKYLYLVRLLTMLIMLYTKLYSASTLGR